MEKTEPKIIELDKQQLEALLDQIAATMGEETAGPFRLLLGWYVSLLALIGRKNLTLRRLRRLLLGSGSERTRDVLPADDRSDDQQQPSGESAGAGDGSHDVPASRSGGARRPARGHGRTAAEAYTGCEQVVVKHPCFQAGDACPECADGTLYPLSASHVVRLKAQPPVGGSRYELERLRCGLCGNLQKAELPEEAGAQKYDPTVASMIATLRYGQGLPWKRIAQIQQSAGIPLPCSVQWELVRDAAAGGPGTVYRQLHWEAAQGGLVHNDDTSMRVQELTVKIQKGEAIHAHDPQRTGVFTTSILSLAEGRPTIALFFTGPRHSGENLRDLLAKRMADLPPPLQMCDALSRNLPRELETIVANCLCHGRRNFCEVAKAFPAEVRYVLECLKQVYQIDAKAKQDGLSPEERLRLHEQRSGPVMDRLYTWLQQQFDQRKVEPNSSLGQAISYMLKHWEKLTLFLRVAGAPLDNNVAERALKLSIRHRKNSLSYKTMRGAEVGDLYMSLIHTCYFSAVDPFDYLTALQRNAERVSASPADWLPWNYRRQLTGPSTAAA